MILWKTQTSLLPRYSKGVSDHLEVATLSLTLTRPACLPAHHTLTIPHAETRICHTFLIQYKSPPSSSLSLPPRPTAFFHCQPSLISSTQLRTSCTLHAGRPTTLHSHQAPNSPHEFSLPPLSLLSPPPARPHPQNSSSRSSSRSHRPIRLNWKGRRVRRKPVRRLVRVARRVHRAIRRSGACRRGPRRAEVALEAFPALVVVAI